MSIGNWSKSEAITPRKLLTLAKIFIILTGGLANILFQAPLNTKKKKGAKKLLLILDIVTT